MSHTDQAFIKAYRNEPRLEAAAPAPVGDFSAQRSRGAGPHVSFTGEKPSLREAMIGAAAPVNPPESAPRDEPVAGITVAEFRVPEVPHKLAARCKDAYSRMLSYALRSGSVIGFLGAGEHVGCSTTVLATALSGSQQDQPIAVIDAAPGENGLARSLGLLNSQSMASVAARGGAIKDALIYSAKDNISLGLGFSQDSDDQRLVGGALRSLTSRHACVLVDLGSDIESVATHPARGADSLRVDAIIIVRRAGQDNTDAAFAQRVLAASGQTVIGLVDSFAA